MVQANFKLTVCSMLASVMVFNSISFANSTCEVSTAKKIQMDKSNSLEDYFGDRTWEVRLAAAELLHKYGNNHSGKPNSAGFQIDQVTEVLLNAVVSGHLNSAQYTLLAEYRDYLDNAVMISVLTSRTKLSLNQAGEKVAPKVVSDSLEAIKFDGPVAQSSVSNLVDKLNPFTYINIKSAAEKKHGPVDPYVHAEFTAEKLRKFIKGERLEVLKYNLDSVNMLAPKEIIRLLREIPAEAQMAALDFLEPKRVGRYDFFPESLINDAQAYLQPEVTLKIINRGGDNWSLSSVFGILKDNPAISSEVIGEQLSQNYSPDQVIDFLNSQSTISLREAQILLNLILPNAHNESEQKNYYTQINGKLYNAADKKKLEELFKLAVTTKSVVVAKTNPVLAVEVKKENPSKGDSALHGVRNQLIITTLLLGTLAATWDPVSTPISDYVKQVYTEQTQGLKINDANQNKKLIDIGKISNEEFHTLKDQTADYSLIRDLIITRINSGAVKTPQDFIDTFTVHRKDNESAYGPRRMPDEVGHLWKIYAREFVEMNPDNYEFNEAKRISANEDAVIYLVKGRLEFGKINSAEDAIETFKPVLEPKYSSDPPPDAEALDELKKEYFKLGR